MNKLKINPPEEPIHQGIELFGITKDLFPKSFVALILGKPGSGKTHLLEELLTREQFLSKKFDIIIYFGPLSFKKIVLDHLNWVNEFNVRQVKKIVKDIQQQKLRNDSIRNVLFVFDDVAADFNKLKYEKYLQTLFFNRRHIIKECNISFIITTQKYTMIPTFVRTTVESLWMFKTTNAEVDTLAKDAALPISRNQLRQHNGQLGQHEFIVINLKNSKIFDHNFDQI